MKVVVVYRAGKGDTLVLQLTCLSDGLHIEGHEVNLHPEPPSTSIIVETRGGYLGR